MFCFKCKEANPTVTTKTMGTMVSVTQHCLKCRQEYEWKSQPLLGGRIPFGNILLSFSILMAVASISKTLLIFRHMGLCVHSARAYFRHQRNYLYSVVLQHWENYRNKLVKSLKRMKETVWSGDGRFDSMGHSAKYGAYTMMCTSVMKIVHFEIVQVLGTKFYILCLSVCLSFCLLLCDFSQFFIKCFRTVKQSNKRNEIIS